MRRRSRGSSAHDFLAAAAGLVPVACGDLAAAAAAAAGLRAAAPAAADLAVVGAVPIVHRTARLPPSRRLALHHHNTTQHGQRTHAHVRASKFTGGGGRVELAYRFASGWLGLGSSWESCAAAAWIETAACCSAAATAVGVGVGVGAGAAPRLFTFTPDTHQTPDARVSCR